MLKTFIFYILLLMIPSEYIFTLPKNKWKSLPQKHFRYATDGKEGKQETLVQLKYDSEFLYINFECKQNTFWNENTYTVSNTPMYNQEVFELFISEGNEQQTPQQYLELEINPNNVIWIGKIHNSSGKGVEGTQMVLPENAGIIHTIKTAKETWSGSLQIPWKLIGEKVVKEYRFNFYRIVSFKSHPNKDWHCSPQECDFLCWSPTLSGENPAFHRPEYFGLLRLK